MQNFYYANTLRNILIAFLDQFNDLQVVRYAKDRVTVVKTIEVPILHGGVEKFHASRLEDESMERYYQTLPRMAVMLDSIEYNPERCVAANELRSFVDPLSGTELNLVITDIVPSPYDITFKLQIKTNSMSDFSQLIENIIPFYNPSLYLRVKEFSFLNLERDLKVTLMSVTPELVEEIDETNTRSINGTLLFKVDAYMFRPLDHAKLIKKIDSKYFVAPDLSLITSASYNEEYRTSGYLALSAAPSAGFDTSGTTESGVNWYTKGIFN